MVGKSDAHGTEDKAIKKGGPPRLTLTRRPDEGDSTVRKDHLEVTHFRKIDSFIYSFHTTACPGIPNRMSLHGVKRVETIAVSEHPQNLTLLYKQAGVEILTEKLGKQELKIVACTTCMAHSLLPRLQHHLPCRVPKRACFWLTGEVSCGLSLIHMVPFMLLKRDMACKGFTLNRAETTDL